MKNLFFLILFAATTYAPVASADWLIGVKAGSMMLSYDETVGDVEEEPINAGLFLGYGFRAGFAYEFEATRAYEPGVVSGADLEVETQALYLSFRSAGSLYLKGRVGAIQSSTDGDTNDADIEETYSLGAGWRWGSSLGIELDYTVISDDIAFAALGLLFWF